MQLPFSAEQFFQVFHAYNTAVWPAQVALTILAVAAFALALVPRPFSGRLISAILAGLWAWLGLVYHLAFFTRINGLAYVFGGLSLLAAASFLWQGVVHRRLEFRAARNVRTMLGLAVIAFALLVYPLWTSLSGHSYPAFPTFGLPCPTTLFTIGMLALAVPPYPRTPLVVPVLWCFVGAQAALLLDVPADLGLLVAGVFGIVLLVRSGAPSVDAPTAARTR